jgi:hypothetical protein
MACMCRMKMDKIVIRECWRLAYKSTGLQPSLFRLNSQSANRQKVKVAAKGKKGPTPFCGLLHETRRYPNSAGYFQPT